jgi:putative SOS response-associated peptidase YedK
MINARAETVKSKPADRNALRQRRGRIPAVGFDAWRPERAQRVDPSKTEA